MRQTIALVAVFMVGMALREHDPFYIAGLIAFICLIWRLRNV